MSNSDPYILITAPRFNDPGAEVVLSVKSEGINNNNDVIALLLLIVEDITGTSPQNYLTEIVNNMESGVS